MEESRAKDVEDIKERLTRIEVMLETMIDTRKLELDKVDSKIYNLEGKFNYQMKELDDRIGRLEGQNSWLWKTVITAIVGSILALVLKV